jgi:hypothetical protein
LSLVEFFLSLASLPERNLKDAGKEKKEGKATMTPFVATEEPASAAPPNHNHQLQRQRNHEQRDDVDDQHRRTAKRPRTMTSTEEIDSTITRPGSVKINVKGAFIVDPDASTPAQANGSDNGRVSPSHHETSDIRLPNHTAIVSHIAVDVGAVFASSRVSPCHFFFFLFALHAVNACPCAV